MYINIDEIKKDTITHVVSLGADCTISYNIRRYFNVSEAYPFDWWVTPLNSLKFFLQDPDIESLFDVNKLTLINDRDSIINPDVGIKYHHDFSRDSNNLIADNYVLEVQNVISKYKFLTTRFFELNNPKNKIIFFRTGGGYDINSENDLIGLLNSRFEKPFFSLVYVEQPDFKDYDWRGDPLEWDKIFKNLNFNLLKNN